MKPLKSLLLFSVVVTCIGIFSCNKMVDPSFEQSDYPKEVETIMLKNVQLLVVTMIKVIKMQVI